MRIIFHKYSSNGFTVTFDYELFDSQGSNDPADGFSFNYGNAQLGELGGAEEGMAKPDGGPIVDGVTENLSFEVDTWRNGDPEQGLNISGVGDGVELDQLAFENGIILEDGSRKEGTMEISWSPQSGASFKTEGLTTNADFADIETPDFTADDGHTFIFSARVGGANMDLFIDNLVISLGSLGAPFQITDIDKQGSEVNLTWTSSPNRVYLVERSESLENDGTDSNRDGDFGFWEEVDDGVISQGDETTFTDEIFDDSKKVFWRVTDMGKAE